MTPSLIMFSRRDRNETEQTSGSSVTESGFNRAVDSGQFIADKVSFLDMMNCPLICKRRLIDGSISEWGRSAASGTNEPLTVNDLSSTAAVPGKRDHVWEWKSRFGIK